MCHMRRRIHVSYEEEDTCDARRYPTRRVCVCVCVCAGIHRDVLMYSKLAECHIIDYQISTDLHAPPLFPVARYDARHLTRDVTLKVPPSTDPPPSLRQLRLLPTLP